MFLDLIVIISPYKYGFCAANIQKINFYLEYTDMKEFLEFQMIKHDNEKWYIKYKKVPFEIFKSELKNECGTIDKFIEYTITNYYDE